MRISIIVSDDDGNNYQGEVELTPATKRVKKVARAKPDSRPTLVAPKSVSFSTPIRAFVKQHAHDMSGAKKFTLLAAYLAKGETGKEVQMTEIEKQWNKMKPLLGGKLNRAHSTRAKESGWVDSPKHGVYVILPDWKGIFDA